MSEKIFVPSMTKLFRNKPIEMYNIVRKGGYFYNHRFYRVKCFPNSFWNQDIAIMLTRYLVLEELKWGREEICENINNMFFKNNRLAMVLKLFCNSATTVVSNCFPEYDIKPWELKSCPNNFWDNPENSERFLLWVIEKEGFSDNIEEFCRNVTIKTFYKYGAGKAVNKIGGLYSLINQTFPGRFKPWDLKKISKIDDELIIEAVKWLIEEKLKWSYQEVCDSITAKVFTDYGLESILQHGCNNSPIIALNKAYPGIYTKNMLKKGTNHPFRNPRS